MIKFEKPIRRDSQLSSRQVGYDWPPTRRDDDSICVIVLAFNSNGIRIDETGGTDNGGNPAIVEIGLVNTVESMHVGIPPRLQGRPIVAVDGNVEAVVRRMLKVMRMTRGIPHDLFRHAAHIDAGATERPVFDHANRCAVLGCSPRMCNTTATATDNEEIKSINQTLSPSISLKRVC